VCDDLDFAFTRRGDLDLIAQVAGTALNLDALVQELLKGGDVEDLVAGGLLGVDDELLGRLGALALGFLQLEKIDLSLLFYAIIASSAFQREAGGSRPTAKRCHIHTV